MMRHALRHQTFAPHPTNEGGTGRSAPPTVASPDGSAAMAPAAVRRRSVAGRAAHRVARRTALCRCSGIAGRLKWGSRSCRRRLDGPRWPRPLRSAPPHTARRSRLAHAQRRAGNAPAGGAGVPRRFRRSTGPSCCAAVHRHPTLDRAGGGTPEAIHEVVRHPQSARGSWWRWCAMSDELDDYQEGAERDPGGRMSTSKSWR